MSTNKRFEVMEAWQAARALTRSVYEVTTSAYFTGGAELKREMQKSSTAIMTSIAEGFQSRTQVPIRQFLGRAEAFAEELRGQLFAALDAGYLPEKEFQELQQQCAGCRVQIIGYLADLRDGTPAKRPVRSASESLGR